MPKVVFASGPMMISLVREEDRLLLQSRIRGFAVRP